MPAFKQVKMLVKTTNWNISTEPVFGGNALVLRNFQSITYDSLKWFQIFFKNSRLVKQ
ncbi:hypothetical protein ATCC53582_00061 [Novacetimonas hansenii]|nr:hypothetical protein ATCC53582_00061 [Novacetimonas hansenii]